jgi:hypothetical protein
LGLPLAVAQDAFAERPPFDLVEVLGEATSPRP